MKNLVIKEIDLIKDEIIKMSDTIYDNPEIGHQEFKASEILTQALQEHGFSVRKDINDMKTAFVASFKGRSDSPIVGLLCEYDALIGMGHACGHNLIGPGSVGAAIALRKFMPESYGTLMVFGTPAEEGGVDNAGGKCLMTDEFKKTDACLIWHPGTQNRASRASSMAREAMQFDFFGKAAHAGAAPWEGINALNAVLIMFRSIDALRQHVKPTVRIHGIIEKGGDAANIVPAHTVAKFYVRALDINYLKEVSEKVKNCARGAALATGTEMKFRDYANIYENTIPIKSLADVIEANIKELGLKVFEQEDGREPSGGSTDIGNVSQVTPITSFSIAIGDEKIRPHSIEFREAARSDKAHEAVVFAAKTMAMTAIDLYTNSEKLKNIRKEWENAKKR